MRPEKLDRSARVRLSLLLTTSFLATIASTPTIAQIQNTPDVKFIDDNGVDISDLSFNVNDEYLSIGEAESRLSYIIRKNNINATVLTDYDAWNDLLNENNYSGYAFQYIDSDNQGVADVYFDGKMEGFTGAGTFSPVESTGSSLVRSGDDYIYTRSDGIVITFGQPLPDLALGEHRALPSLVQMPDGTKIKIHYKEVTSIYGTFYRIQSVTNNFGYQLKFGYGAANSRVVTSVTAINNAVDYCDPTADSCSGLTQTWPSISISSSNPTGSLATTPNITSVTDAAGGVHQYTIGPGASYQLTGIKHPASTNNDVTLAYASGGGTSNSVTRNGVTYTYQVGLTSASEPAFIRTDPLGNTMMMVQWNNSFCPKGVEDEFHHRTSFQCDSNGRVSRTTFPEGNYQQITFDSRGNITETRNVAKPGSGLPDIVTSATYPSSCVYIATCNKPSTTTDERGNVTNYTYDNVTGQILAITEPAPTTGGTRPEIRYEYSSLQAYYKNSSGSIVASGEPVSMLTATRQCQTGYSCLATADEVRTEFSYGPQTSGTANNLHIVGTFTADGYNYATTSTSFQYDAIGNQTVVDGPLYPEDDTTRYRYDVARRLVGVIGPDPDGTGTLKHRAVRTTFNANSQPTDVSVGALATQSDTDWANFTPIQSVRTDYDANGRKAQERQVSGGTTYAITQYSYDSLGRPDCIALRMNPSTYTSLPSSACTQATAGSFGPDQIQKVSYDIASRVSQTQSGYGTSAVATDESATYSVNGKIATRTDGENHKTTYEYDGQDRVTKVRFPSPTTAGTSSTTDYIQSTYDTAGNVTAMRLRDGQSIGFTYDNLNRKTFKDLPGSEPDVTYTYDNLGRVTGASQTGNALTFTYDALGRNLTQSGPLGTVSYEYDAAGRRTRMTWPDSFYVTYDHLVTGEVRAVHENGSTTGLGVLATYTYDDSGRETSLTYGNGTTATYAYDSVSRLTSLAINLDGGTTTNDVTTTFGYSPAAQVVTQTRSNDLYAWGGHFNVARSYTTNGLNQYTTSGAVSIGYDARGNVTSAGSDSYGYSSENLLTSATVGGTASTHDYDPMLRIYKSTTSVGQRYQYDGTDLIGLYNDAGTMTKRFVFGAGVDEPVVVYAGSGTGSGVRTFFHADERGSIIAQSDESGAKTGISSYDEYGVPGAANNSRFQYTGQAWVAPLGMYYYKARMYSPALGRFMQADRIGYSDGMNMYAYVHNNPIGGADPSGLEDPYANGGSGWVIDGHRWTGGVVIDSEPIGEPMPEKGEGQTPRLAQRGDRQCTPQAAAWAGAYGSQAQRLAAVIGHGANANELLAISSVETQWGESGARRLGNNYFGLHNAGAAVEGQTGTYITSGTPGADGTVVRSFVNIRGRATMPTFDAPEGFYYSGLGVARRLGSLGIDYSNAPNFFSAARTHGWGLGFSNADYVATLMSRYKRFLACNPR